MGVRIPHQCDPRCPLHSTRDHVAMFASCIPHTTLRSLTPFITPSYKPTQSLINVRNKQANRALKTTDLLQFAIDMISVLHTQLTDERRAHRTYGFGGVVLSNAASIVHKAEVALISSHLGGVVLEHLLHLRIALHAEVNVVSLLERERNARWLIHCRTRG